MTVSKNKGLSGLNLHVLTCSSHKTATIDTHLNTHFRALEAWFVWGYSGWMEAIIKEYSWVIAIALMPLFYLGISALAWPFHRFVEKHLPDGKLKDMLIDPEFESKFAANPDKYKATAKTKDRQ